ncbi:MAG: hypothetical protein IRY99_01790 [Isosphaeraceae bacterium]|nr:hypothetical protein [Isosphaeraceae bacterium]
MSYSYYLRFIGALLPVVFLLTVGFALTLRSGVVRWTSKQGLRRLMGNLSQTIVFLMVSLIVLAALQQMAGYKLTLLW